MTPFGITMFVIGGIGLIILILVWRLDKKKKS